MDRLLHRTSRKSIPRRVPLAKVSQLVVEALKALKHPDGCTLHQLRSYVSEMHGKINDEAILDKVPMALQRGVQFGAIKQSGNFYKLDAIMVMASTKKQTKQAETQKPRVTQQAERKGRKNKRVLRKKDESKLGPQPKKAKQRQLAFASNLN